MTGLRLGAFLFAGVATFAVAAQAAALWHMLRDTTLARRLANLLYPLSQAACATVALVGCYALELGTGLVALVGLFSLGSLVYDAFLFRRLVTAERTEMAELKNVLLAEQLDAQDKRGTEIEDELKRARQVRCDMVEKMERLQEALDRGDLETAAGMLAKADTALGQRESRYCENPSLDALLAAKASHCAELGIPFTANIAVPEELGIPNVELCAVFANLIDNAVNACVEMGGQGDDRANEGAGARVDAFVTVDAMVAAGYLSVCVQNPCPSSAKRARLTHGLAQGLNDEHGWGKSIVALLARRHDGDCAFEVKGGMHIAKATLHV